MSELWDLVDINGRKTGILHERERVDFIPEGMFHIVVDIWTKRGKEILLTQRHPSKPYPLKWENTGGSVIAGEETLDGAVRELKEETGLSAQRDRLIYLGREINYKRKGMYESYLFIMEDEQELHLQAEEVVAAKFVRLNEMDKYKDEIVDGVWHRFCRYRNRIERITGYNDVYHLVPKDKCDVSSIAELSALTDSEIEPIIYDLLEWIQDYNWLVAQELMPVLREHEAVVFPHIKGILDGDDFWWKYWIVNCLVPYFSNEHSETLKAEIESVKNDREWEL